MSSQYFPIYLVNFKNIKIELDLSNYATKTDFKNLNADTSSFALKINLADLKSKFDNLQSVFDLYGINNLLVSRISLEYPKFEEAVKNVKKEGGSS